MTLAIDQINQAAIDAGETYRTRPPESMRPYRSEVNSALGSGTKQTLDAGVVVEWLVGDHVGSRNLATGILSCSPGATWLGHRHPHFASITLLEGAAVLRAESQKYDLQILDNVVVRPGVTHSITNYSTDTLAVFHVAYPVATPVTSRWSEEPQVAHGFSKPMVYVTRHATASRYEASANATFINYFSNSLVPGIPMCGGYGFFGPGGRLPAHLHDFDESICIVQGTATCWVEGRRYIMDEYETALQPRGRVHYFINNTNEPMAMVWVYAGPTAERLVVDERCGIELGVAW